MKKLFLLSVLVSLLAGCGQQGVKVDYAVDPANREIVAGDVLQASSYTYILANEKSQQYWIAVSRADVETGKTYYFSESMEMVNFHSKELDRTFDLILFVGNLSDMPVPAQSQAARPQMSMPQASKTPAVKQDIKVEPVEGSMPLQQLFDKPDNFSGKVVKVAGQVTKFNSGIMGKNWVHIQDGSANEDFFDLTITTKDDVAVGDVVIFEGTITLNKDLGSGYFFKILMEDAKASKLSLQ